MNLPEDKFIFMPLSNFIASDQFIHKTPRHAKRVAGWAVCIHASLNSALAVTIMNTMIEIRLHLARQEYQEKLK